MNTTPKQGYKIVKSLFGNEEIPEDWSIKNLGTISELFIPMRDKPKQFDGDIPWLRIEDLDDKFASDSKSHQRVSKNTVENMNLRIYPVGTVLCSCSATIGVCAITTRELITNQTFIGIYPTSQLNKEFLYYYLLTQKNNLKRIGSGSTILYISREKFEGFPIIIPPLNEQQKIASILSNIDSLIHKTQKIIEQTQNLKKGLMQKLLTKGIGHTKFKETKLGKLPEEWEIISLENCVKKNAPITYGIVQAGPHIENGIPYIRTGDMKNDRLSKNGMLCTSKEIVSKYKRSEVKTGELVFAIRATVGKVLEVPPELDGANLTQGTARISPNAEFNNHYLLNALRGAYVQKQIREVIKGTTFAEITLHNLRTIKIVKPSLAEQNKIARILDHTYFILETLEKKEFSLETLKKGLMQKLLTGQIRVKV